MSFLGELKRRNVFRVGVAYLLGAWVLLQVADFIFDVIGAPRWIIQALTALAAIGLPAVLVFTWVFEMTPQGLKREKDVDRSRSITGQTGRKIDRVIIVFLAVAVVLLLADRYTGRENSLTVSKTATAETIAPVKKEADGAPSPPVDEQALPSVAVLPFVNMSADVDNEYFSDGITEELLNLLVKVNGLRVPSRTSSFAFKGQNIDIREIARQLGVGHVVEGSVRKAGNRVRITAQLIDVSSDTHLWSETYDRELEDIFAIQDEIAANIVSSLSVVLGGAQKKGPPTRNIEAYNLFLQGRQLFQQRGPGLRDAVRLLLQAVELDPGFAEAWGTLAMTYTVFPNYVPAPPEESERKALQAADKALALDPGLAEPILVRANYARRNQSWLEAFDQYRDVIDLNPHDAVARLWFGVCLLEAGYITEAHQQFAEAVRNDPVSGVNLDWYARTLLMLGQPERAIEMARKSLTLNRPPAMYVLLHAVLEGGDPAIISADLESYGATQARSVRVTLEVARDPAKMDAALRDFEQTEPNGQIASRFLRANLAYALKLPAEYAAAVNAFRVSDQTIVSDQWYAGSSWFRQDVNFKLMAEQLRLPELWRQRGWPDLCRPVGENDYECD